MPEEPRGTEPAALVAQAADAVDRVAAAGLLPAGARVAEYGSPHGGSWLGLLADRGLKPVDDAAEADVILDCFGMMHAADQAAALAERAARLAPGGVLLLQYHSLDTIIRHRPVERAAARSLRVLLDHRADRDAGRGRLQPAHGVAFRPLRRHRAARRRAATRRRRPATARRRRSAPCSPRRPAPASATRTSLRGLQQDVAGQRRRAARLARPAARPPGRPCSATAPHPGRSRCCARPGLTATCCPRWRTRRPAKQGLRMPGTAIPVISPAELTARRPDEVALFVSDLMAEVRAAYPEIEAGGGHWVDADALSAARPTSGASSSTRSRARQRPLVGPMLPTGSPSSSEISA